MSELQWNKENLSNDYDMIELQNQQFRNNNLGYRLSKNVQKAVI